MPIARFFACAALIAVASVSLAHAQSTAYTITQAVGNDGTQTIYRSGNKVLVESMLQSNHSKSLYDLAAQTSLAWNPDASPITCSAGTFHGDWGDPFQMTSEVNDGVAKGELKPAGTAMVAGTQAMIYAGEGQSAGTKVWFDKPHNLVLRVEALMPGSTTPTTMIDIRKVSLVAPPASLFVPPPTCAGVKPPPSTAELIAEETGDNPANYVKAAGPGSPSSCSIVLKVVQAKTMTPVTNIQVAIDTTYKEDNPPHYVFGVRDDGSQSYSGGGIREITNMVHNGVVRLGTPPAVFGLGVNHIRPGHAGSAGIMYRQCFAPTTVLLYVVKDIDTPNENADWLYVKSGKYATP
jgi:hypothetical protein